MKTNQAVTYVFFAVLVIGAISISYWWSGLVAVNFRFAFGVMVLSSLIACLLTALFAPFAPMVCRSQDKRAPAILPWWIGTVCAGLSFCYFVDGAKDVALVVNSLCIFVAGGAMWLAINFLRTQMRKKNPTQN